MPSEWIRPSFGGSKSATVDKTAITTAIASLNPDQYLGTLGLLADKPVSAVKTHYTAFPEANAGAWLRVVSDATINDRAVLTDQNWICLEDNTPSGTPAKWEISQRGQAKAQYPTYANRIGSLKRSLDLNKIVSVPSGNTGLYIPLERPYVEGCFVDPYGKDTQVKSALTDLYDLVVNDVRFDIYLSVRFQPDLAGRRKLEIVLLIYYPEEGDRFSLNLVSAAYSEDEGTTSFRPELRFTQEEPLDENPLTYAVGGIATQDSGGPLKLTFAELKIIAFK